MARSPTPHLTRITEQILPIIGRLRNTIGDGARLPRAIHPELEGPYHDHRIVLRLLFSTQLFMALFLLQYAFYRQPIGTANKTFCSLQTKGEKKLVQKEDAWGKDAIA